MSEPIPTEDGRPDWLECIKWGADGLVPVIAQELATKDILMVAWMNEQALQKTVELGRAVYFSRSRGKLWFKGEESGHIQRVHEMRLDCDRDVILLTVTQEGHEPSIACHTGRHSCFYQKLDITHTEKPQWVEVDPVLKNPQSIYKS
jgi:phosphoribosyl-AMP cyclohydrolase